MVRTYFYLKYFQVKSCISILLLEFTVAKNLNTLFNGKILVGSILYVFNNF